VSLIRKNSNLAVITKNNEQKQRIISKVTNSFLLDNLEDKDLNTVIDAMDEKKYKSGEKCYYSRRKWRCTLFGGAR
jgi:phenylpyruvate tautomerase PptA (4-oxalocrotonate tautomerase family)